MSTHTISMTVIENTFEHLTKTFQLNCISDLRFFDKKKIKEELNNIKSNITQSQLSYICNYIEVEV